MFLFLYNFFRSRRAFLWLLLAVITGMLLFSASRISFVEDISSFLPNSNDNQREHDAYRKLGAAANKIIVTFAPTDSAETIDTEMLTAAATRFSEIMLVNDSTGHITEVNYVVDGEQINELTGFITQNLPYFLDEDDYCQIDSLIQPDAIQNTLQVDRNLLMSPMGGFVRGVLLNDPLHFSQNVLSQLNGFKQTDTYVTDDNGFLFNQCGECIVTITSDIPVSETAMNRQLANEIYTTIEQTHSEFHGAVRIVAFGAALVSITNADRIKSDAIFAVSVSLVLILLLLLVFFRSFKSIILIVLTIAFGALFSLGIIVIFRDTVSLIAIGVASIIFGVAINYPLHLLAHFRHHPNVRQTIKDIVNPLVIGNITTVGAFLSLLFISSDAMRDLGLFASLLLAGTVIFTLVFLPHFLKDVGLTDAGCENNMPTDEPAPSRLQIQNPKPENLTSRIIKYIAIIFPVLTVALFFLGIDAKFQTDLHAINYMTPQQHASMQQLMEAGKNRGATWYAVTEGVDIQQALQRYDSVMIPAITAMCDSGWIAGISGVGRFFPSREVQQQKIDRWNRFWQDEQTQLHQPAETKKDRFIETFEHIARNEGFNHNAFGNFIATLHKSYKPRDFDFFNPLYNTAGSHYFSITDQKILIYTLVELRNIDVTTLQAYWDCAHGADRTIYAFGDLHIAQRMVETLSGDFNRVLFICAFIVFAFLYFAFGRMELAILTFIPLAAGWIWILGLMNMLDIRFNIVNIILATFIFGQGDDYTIFVTEGLIYEYTYRRRMLASFKKSILLSAAILFVGIGTLIFAQHPAMRSLAEVTIVGMISVVACAYLLPPLMFRILTVRRGASRLMPITLANFASSVFAFFIFLLGSFTATIVGFFMFAVTRATDRKKLIYHRLINWFARFVVVRIPRVKTTCTGAEHGDMFNRPAIIICNHQSHIDLMCAMSLTPKLIVLTNDWVWNSPFYGRMIKYADYYPVSNGIEQALPRLRDVVARGYSILIFPEGTRSVDCSIQRFHRGAFYLAEQLQIDLLPVILHGVGHFLPKREFMLRRGEIHINVLPRVRWDAMGSTCSERARNMRQLYREQYAALAASIETADYYADRVAHNYIYKGAHISRSIRRNLRKHENYRSIIAALKGCNRVAVINCGYGEMPLLLSLVYPKMHITATDPDADSIALAANCASAGANLHYAEAITTYTDIDAAVLIQPTELQHAEWKRAGAALYIIPA